VSKINAKNCYFLSFFLIENIYKIAFIDYLKTQIPPLNKKYHKQRKLVQGYRFN